MTYNISEINFIEDGISDLLFPKYEKVNGEKYQVIEIVKDIIDYGNKCLILTGDSGYGKTQSAKKILSILHIQYNYISLWCEGKNLNLEKLEAEIEPYESSQPIVVCFDGLNNLSERMMRDIAKCIDQLLHKNILVIVTTIKIPAEINEIIHIEFHANKIENEIREKYLKDCVNKNAEKLMPILDSPMILRMVKDTNINMNFNGYIQGMKLTCQTKADVFWNYNLSFIPKKLDESEKEQKKRFFTFQYLTGIIADIMYMNNTSVINVNHLISEVKQEEKYIEYCLRRSGLDIEWYQEGIGIKECLKTLISQNIISAKDSFLEFSHDLYEIFYLALNEYNLSYWSINDNKYVPSKVVLDNKVGKLYFELFDNTEIEKLEKYIGIKYRNLEYNYTAIRANNVLSDIYYYGNGSSVEPNILRAFEYS